jgi:uncharacterized protein YacL
MTKKEFIWLGIRAIGIYWLIQLIFTIFMLVYVAVFMLILKNNTADQANFTGTCIVFLSNIPAPIILTIYFLFFGKLVYKLINHFTQPGPTDCLQATGYPAIIVRFIGLWSVGMMMSRLYASFMGCVQSFLTLYFIHPEYAQQHTFATTFRQQFFNIQTIISLSIYIILSFFVAWYFFKKGNLFINLLNRLWSGKNREDLNQNPAESV